MFYNFGYEISDLLKEAEKIRYNLRHPYVGTEHLLLAILKSDTLESQICQDFGLTYENFQNELETLVGHASKASELNLYTPMLKRVLEVALNEAAETNQGKVLISHLLFAMLEEGDGVAIRVMMALDIDLDNLYEELKENVVTEKKKKNLEITKIGIHLTGKCNKKNVLVGRENEIEMMIETLLRKQKNNPLLIGKAGVGKTALVEELARRIVCKEVPLELQNMEIYELEMGSLVAGTKYRGEFEERLTKIIKEVIKEKNIIIFIDEIHCMVKAGGAEGAICASDILKPYLARGEIKVIGSTTLQEYHENIAVDKALDRRFEHIIIEEPNESDMIEILKSIKPSYEQHYKIKLTTENLTDLITLANKYIFTKNNPDKTIDLLDSVCAKIKFKSKDLHQKQSELKKVIMKKEKLLKQGYYQDALKIAKKEQEILNNDENHLNLTMTKDDILEVIESKTKLIIRKSNEEIIANLKQNLFQKIKGQDEVLNKLLETMEVHGQNGTSFLLVGGSGVGKTQTVKIISDVLKTKLIRIDMSEYHLEESINRLLGAPSGYVGYGKPYVFQELLEQPYATVLFDEIEKAHPKVLNLLLQILDEGFITDSLGNIIHFNHTYIFLTSNIKIGDKIGFTNQANDGLDAVLSKELVGRIDAILPYQSISRQIALKYIEENLENNEIDYEKLLEESNYEKYGLRDIQHLIKKYNKKSVHS